MLKTRSAAGTFSPWAVKDKEIDERIKQQTEKLFGEGPKEIDRRYFPARSNDVPNRPALTLVVLGLENSLGDKATLPMLETIVRECGTSGRTYKSALIFAVPDAAEPIREATRNLLAWEGIDDDEETKSRLDDAQKRLLARNLNRAESDAKEAIWRAYRNLFLLGPDDNLRQIDLGQVTSSMAKTIVELYLNELIRTDEVTKGVGASKLVRYWPPALTEWSTKGVRDAFYSSPQLPRLLDGDAIKRTIADGVGQGVLGYATKDSRGQLKLDRFQTSLAEGEVEISDDVFILRAEDAQKLLEPPRLAQLLIQPTQASVKLGQQQAFTCTARDQYGQPLAIPTVTWKASGGTVADDGVFTTGDSEGRFTVHATAQGVEAVAEIQAYRDAPIRPPVPHQHVIRWSGEIPPQKWMNFYTKVLTRFVATKELKIRVSFEAPAEGEQGAAKANETKTGLKELGLDDNVSIG